EEWYSVEKEESIFFFWSFWISVNQLIYKNKYQAENVMEDLIHQETYKSKVIKESDEYEEHA
ncbi:unnamed protein product, partial [marine sediment metagenome]